jgi:hypothetical protein
VTPIVHGNNYTLYNYIDEILRSMGVVCDSFLRRFFELLLQPTKNINGLQTFFGEGTFCIANHSSRLPSNVFLSKGVLKLLVLSSMELQFS